MTSVAKPDPQMRILEAGDQRRFAVTLILASSFRLRVEPAASSRAAGFCLFRTGTWEQNYDFDATERMDEETFTNDPLYRAGILMGQQQAVTDIMAILMDPSAGEASEKLLSLLEWCAQTRAEAQVEVKMVVAAIEDGKAA